MHSTQLIFSRINIRLITKDSRNNTSIIYMSDPSIANAQTQQNVMSISIDNYENSSNLKKLNRLLNNEELYTNKISTSLNSLINLQEIGLNIFHYI